MSNHPVPLDLLVGPERAAAYITSRARDLIEQDRIPEPTAYALVCEAVTDSDPWMLADPGQTWLPRHDLPQEAVPVELYIVHRKGPEVLLEDEAGQRAWAQVGLLASYWLSAWHWTRQDSLR